MTTLTRVDMRMFSRARQYVTRGHVTVSLGIGLVNTCVIWFGLIPSVKTAFGTLTRFLVIFVPTYVGFSLGLGYWDMNRGTYRHEQAVAAEWSPIWQDLFFCIERIGRRLGDDEVSSTAHRWIIKRTNEKKQTEEKGEGQDG